MFRFIQKIANQIFQYKTKNPILKKRFTCQYPLCKDDCYQIRNCFRCQTIIYLCKDKVGVKNLYYYCKYCRDLID